MKSLSILVRNLVVFLIPFMAPQTFAFRAASTVSCARRPQTKLALMTQNEHSVSRRYLLQSIALSTASVALVTASPVPVSAASRKDLDDCLYTILRVREATQQEARLIKSGKFKDVQRANVKLAVKYIVNNYQLADTFVAASAYIDGDNSRRVSAGEQGQAVVQNLYTILEYFDSADVQNLKVGTANNMAGKEDLVLKGLDTARQNIDDFLAYFPKDKIEGIRSKILEENELNKKEWDPSLGDIVNLPQVV